MKVDGRVRPAFAAAAVIASAVGIALLFRQSVLGGLLVVSGCLLLALLSQFAMRYRR
jgi:hypothetical protein